MTDNLANESKPIDPTRPWLRVVCHDLMSLNNIGSIFRTADGAGFDEVVLSGICGTPPQRGLVKVSLGAENYLSWRKLKDVDAVLDYIAGDIVVACEQTPSSIHYQKLDLEKIVDDALGCAPQSISVIVGSEREGADIRLLERADVAVEIPMRGSKESLNVANAFTLIAYEVAEQVYNFDPSFLRGHVPEMERRRRPGLLTNGITHGESPNC